MISYELAKQLKDLGFPQTKKDGVYLSDIGILRDEYGADGSYAPTLSELIEACGDGFLSLNRSKVKETGNFVYRAFPFRKLIEQNFLEADDMESVVALLWLELNKVTKNKA